MKTLTEIMTDYKSALNEAKSFDLNPKKKGMWDGWTIAELKDERERLKGLKKRTEADTTRLRQVNFAIRAKQKNKFGKISEAKKVEGKKSNDVSDWSVRKLKAEKKRIEGLAKKTVADDKCIRVINKELKARKITEAKALRVRKYLTSKKNKTLQERIDLHKINAYLAEEWHDEEPLNPKKKGMWGGWTVDELKAERERLKNLKHRTKADTTRLREVNFALHAKEGWHKHLGEADEHESGFSTKDIRETLDKVFKDIHELVPKAKYFTTQQHLADIANDIRRACYRLKEISKEE